jgi:hypothetical protein
MRDEPSASERSPDKSPPPPSPQTPPSKRPETADARAHGGERTRRRHGRYRRGAEAATSKDISGILKGWDYESGTINVRKVAGLDGSPKLQLRLDLGLLQMELTGRPDGQRPHGAESLLEYHESLLHEHQKRNGTDLGFALTSEQCQSLRDEATMYYHRYLSLFVLGEFAGVVRDTARNLRVIDLCSHYAAEEQDRLILEQYRPYIIMMNTRAAASIEFKENHFADALATIDGGLKKIRSFFARFGHEEAYGQSSEVKVLRKFARDIRKRLPVDPVRKLKGKLERAIKLERYEDAARLRDQISELASRRREVGP